MLQLNVCNSLTIHSITISRYNDHNSNSSDALNGTEMQLKAKDTPQMRSTNVLLNFTEKHAFRSR